MFIGTHILAPVFIAETVNLLQTAGGKGRVFSKSELIYAGICGALPDILWPHIRLTARMSSPTHNLWFVLTAIAVLGILCVFRQKRFRFRAAVLYGTAIALHLFCDALSGGIALFYPCNSERIGHYYIHPGLWLPLDIIFLCMTLAILTFSAISEREKRKNAKFLRLRRNEHLE